MMKFKHYKELIEKQNEVFLLGKYENEGLVSYEVYDDSKMTLGLCLDNDEEFYTISDLKLRKYAERSDVSYYLLKKKMKNGYFREMMMSVPDHLNREEWILASLLQEEKKVSAVPARYINDIMIFNSNYELLDINEMNMMFYYCSNITTRELRDATYYHNDGECGHFKIVKTLKDTIKNDDEVVAYKDNENNYYFKEVFDRYEYDVKEVFTKIKRRSKYFKYYSLLKKLDIDDVIDVICEDYGVKGLVGFGDEFKINCERVDDGGIYYHITLKMIIDEVEAYKKQDVFSH